MVISEKRWNSNKFGKKVIIYAQINKKLLAFLKIKCFIISEIGFTFH